MAINTPHQHGSYQAKLFDKRWQMKREIILNRDNHQCVICGKTDSLIVHHKQYHFIKKLNIFCEPWNYQDIYLITLLNRVMIEVIDYMRYLLCIFNL